MRDIVLLQAGDGYPLKWSKIDFPIHTFFDSAVDKRLISTYRIAAKEIDDLVGRALFDLGVIWPFGALPAVAPRGALTIGYYSADMATECREGIVTYDMGSGGRIRSANLRFRRGIYGGGLRSAMYCLLASVVGVSTTGSCSSKVDLDTAQICTVTMVFTSKVVKLLREVYT